MPGFGSLLAGHASGYLQIALSLGGTALTMIFGARFVLWYLNNLARFQGAQSDPIDMMPELWAAVRWPLLGIGLFAFGWLWALSTGLYIVRTAQDTPPAAMPPKLG